MAATISFVVSLATFSTLLHGTVADFRDGLFRLGGFGSDLFVGFGDGLVEVGLHLCLGFVDDALRLGTGIDQRLVIGRFGRFRLRLEILGGGDIVCDRALPFRQNRTNAGQRDA